MLRSLPRLWRAARLHVDIATVLRQKLGSPVRGREVTYRLRGGPSLTVESGVHDLWVVNEVWLDRVYAVDERLIPRAGWLVYDVGAHKGVYSTWAASQMGSGCIHAFEPQPRNFGFLEMNTARVSTVEFRLNRTAISAHGGEIELFVSPDDSGLASIHHGRHSFGGSITVPCMSLVDAVARADARIDLMKMDTEGAEHSILGDSPAGALNPVDRIVLEYHTRSPNDHAPETTLVSDLEARGFDVSVIPERQMLYGLRPGL